MDKNKSKQVIECSFCNSNANLLCFKCNNYFCEKCFKIIHDLPKNSNHKKESIDLFVPIDIKCSEHPEHPYFLFCLKEKSNYKLFILFISFSILFFKSLTF